MGDTSQLEERVRQDLERIRETLRREAELTLQGVDTALKALAARDRRLAYAVMLGDNRIDVLEGHIDRLCQEFLVRHMPVAEQLRLIIAVMKVNGELERIGDYAEAIARRVVALPSGATFPSIDKILEMGRLAYQILRQSVDAFLKGNTDLAMATLDLDNQVDMMNKGLHVDLAHPEKAESDLSSRFLVLEILNRIERISDRAGNIAEETIYVVRGQTLRHLPRRDVRVLFLCDQNACRSQMAEAIARKHSPPHFVFSSAGWDARPGGPLDPGMQAFMAKKEYDVAGRKPKSLAEIGSAEDYHVVVALSQQAKEHCPPLAFDAIELDWEIPDPSKATGTADQVELVYRGVHDELETKITELVESLVGAHADHGEDV